MQVRKCHRDPRSERPPGNYAVTCNSSMPDDHTVIRGKTLYCQIIYNHRLCYVKAADVVVRYLR